MQGRPGREKVMWLVLLGAEYVMELYPGCEGDRIQPPAQRGVKSSAKTCKQICYANEEGRGILAEGRLL